MPKLCLIDASGYIHRAFHAVPPLTTSKGQPVNAVYGFSRMISKVLKDERPDYIGVCFDTAAPTFRHKAYPEYKAHRKEIDTALISQLPLAEELVEKWGIPTIKKEGFEADDLIATLARQGVEKGWSVLVLSGDKDILQLVEEKIHVRDEMKNVLYDIDKVKERFGILPHQLVDYFCLVGDKVDNVMGVPGVGDKTASKLLVEHGSLEGLFEHLNSISANGKSANLQEKLQAFKGKVFENRTLIRLDDKTPLNIPLESLKPQKPDLPVFTEFLTRLEFRGGIYGVDVSNDAHLATNQSRKVEVVFEEAALNQLREKVQHANKISYDLETDSLDKFSCRIVGFSFSLGENTAFYIPVGHSYIGVPHQLTVSQVKSALGSLFKEPSLLKCGQNLKFDNTILSRHGFEVNGPFFDTMVAAYCLDPSRNSFGLKDLAADFLNEKMTRIDELIGKGKEESFVSVQIEKAAPYAGADSEVVSRLVELFVSQLREKKVDSLFNDLEMPLVSIIQEMENSGVLIDQQHLQKVGARFASEKNQLEKEIFDLAGEEFVLNSPKQLSRILFEKLKLPVIKKTKTGFSTDEEVLNKLALQHPICEKIITCRELSKLISTYVESLSELVRQETGRIHTTFHQTGTITGRLSSSDPNLQNIPIRTEKGKEIRKAFIASPGHVLLSADYSQIDLRSLAHISEDPALIQAFHSDGDVHTFTASQMFQVDPKDVTPEMRRNAKTINFGIVYGQQAYALSQSLGIELNQAKEFIHNYFDRYAGVRAWIESSLEVARKTGFVTTLAGRRRAVPDINSSNAFTRGFAERVAINTPIQGTSADIIKFAMIRVSSEIHKNKFQTKMILQVHDELLFEVPSNELNDIQDLVRQSMEEAFKLRVPLKVDLKVGPNWNDMQKIKEGSLT